MLTTFCVASLSSINLVLKYSQRAGLVMSSAVGPKPPVMMIMLLWFASSANVCKMACLSSAIATLRFTHTPILFNSCAMKALLVSMVWPINNSSPMVMMEAFISIINESLNFSAMYNQMKKIICLLIVLTVVLRIHAQSVTSQLTAAFKVFENDSQLKSAIASLYVID